MAFKILKDHHILIGWVAFSAAFVHGSYFFLQTSEEMESIFSGLVTLIGFAILVSFGLLLNKLGNRKYKKIHQWIAIVFGIALGVHLLFG
jgi:threonine/homoserine/homoserine lactone efflux protein